jgi:hypothetical protein
MSYAVLLLAAGVTIYALVDCWNSFDDDVRGLPRLAWLLVVFLFPLVGGVAYLLIGRERRAEGSPRHSRVIAPDDDPEFLRQLDLQRRRADADERRHEQQLFKERRERDRQERQHRQEPKGSDHDGEDHSGHPRG